jgi:hypothetical protein
VDTRFLEGQLGYGVFNSWLQNYLDFINKRKILDLGILKTSMVLGHQKFNEEIYCSDGKSGDFEKG